MVQPIKSHNKEQLIQRFELQRQERRNALQKTLENHTAVVESAIIRRLSMVPKGFAELRIKDVLAVERKHKVKMGNLIADVQKLHNSASLGHDEKQIRDKLAMLKKANKENVRIVQKRKESMATGKVSKLTKSNKSQKK